MDTLTSEQASSLVAHLGLGAIYTALQGAPQKPYSRLPTFDSGHISAIAVSTRNKELVSIKEQGYLREAHVSNFFQAKLNKLVSNPDLYLLPQLTLLASVTRRIQIQRRAGAVIHSIYVQLYNAVHDPDNQFADPQNLLSLNPDIVLGAFSR